MTSGDRPIDVCVVNPFGYELFDPAARASRVFGGAEVQLYYLATALARDDRFTVSMIVERPAGGVADASEGVRMHAVPPVSARLGRLRDRVPFPVPAYWSAMRRAAADIYLQRGGAVLTGDVAAFCAVNRRLFAFMAAHDWDCDRRHERGRQYLAGRYYSAGLRRASIVYAQSGDQRDLLTEHYGISSMVLRTAYPLAGAAAADRSHVLWVGRCVGWKRPLAFLDLAASRPDIRFVMVCPRYDGESELFEAVGSAARTLGNVELIEFVPFSETTSLFGRALAFVNTSTVEGFPNTFVQAARCGTPIISLDVNPDRLLDRADIGFGADGDPAVLGARLDELLADRGTWDRLSANCLTYFEREHAIDRIAARFAMTLERIARASAATPGGS